MIQQATDKEPKVFYLHAGGGEDVELSKAVAGLSARVARMEVHLTHLATSRKMAESTYEVSGIKTMCSGALYTAALILGAMAFYLAAVVLTKAILSV